MKGDFSETMNVNVRVQTAEVKKYPEVFSKALLVVLPYRKMNKAEVLNRIYWTPVPLPHTLLFVQPLKNSNSTILRLP